MTTLVPLTGAADGFGAFAQPHLPTLTWFAACLAPGEHEDLVQRALTRAWQQRSRFDQDDLTERAWLCTMLVEQSRRDARRPSSGRSWESVVQGPDGGDPVHVERIDADPVELGRALALLPASQRRAVECHHLVGLTPADTASVMGCSADTVGSALAEARLRLCREVPPNPARAPGGQGAVLAGREAGPAGPGTDEPDRSRDVDRRVDSLLRRAGAQFRAQVPSAVFEQPSPRMSMLGRRARIGLSSGIAAVIVGVLVAGSVIARQSAMPVTPGAVISGSIPQFTPRAVQTRPTPSASSISPPVYVGSAAAVAGTRRGWPSAGLIRATESVAGAAGGVRMAWEVATGELLAGIPERLLCNDKQIRLRLDTTGALHLDLFGGIGADQGCTRDSLKVVAFAPLDGQNEGESVVRVTGTTGSLLLPGLSGLELDPVGSGTGLPSVSGVRTIGTSPDVDVQWQPRTGRLLVAARGCDAFATADLGDGTEVTVVVRPTDRPCSGAARTLTHVIQIPPHPPGSPFQVVVLNSTVDRAPTTDVFSVPATLLRPGGSRSSSVPRLVDLSMEAKKLTGIDRIGRSLDNTLYFDIETTPGAGEVRVPAAELVADQTIVLSRGTERIRIEASKRGTFGVARDIPSVSDVRRPLLIRIGEEVLVLPAL